MSRWIWGLGSLALGAASAWRYRARVNMPFEPTLYVWSRGLGLLCDHNGGVDFVKRQAGGTKALRFEPSAFDGIREGDLVWTRHIALPQFVEEVLPRVRHRFTLVTGDEDWAIPSGFGESHRIVNDDRVILWFTQNYDGTDESGKIRPLPIGLDFHTISNRRKWGHWPAPPNEQEAELLELLARAPATRDRELLVHSDFHFSKNPRTKPQRHELWKTLRGSELFVYEKRKLRRIDLWEKKTRYAFVISPHGVGLDCHRTWESLVLGNIVIVQRSSLDPLYEGLPVVIVDDWSEITRASLKRWHEQHHDAFARPEVQERLTNRHWIDRMRSETRDALRAQPDG